MASPHRRLVRKGAPSATDDHPLFHILVGTWNVGACAPNSAPDLSDWLCPNSVRVSVDLYVIGLQEAQPLSGVDAVRTDKEKGDLWKAKLAKSVGPNYDALTSKQLTGIVLVLFLHKRHRLAWSGLDVAYAATGFMKQGNKGGVAARFVIYDRSVCCVVAHLSADDDKVERRNEDFKEILRKAVFSPQGSNASVSDGAIQRVDPTSALKKNFTSLLSTDFKGGGHSKRMAAVVTAATQVVSDLKEGGDSRALQDPHAVRILDHDLVIWLGDLNYRIDEDPRVVLKWVKERNWSALQAADQFNKVRRTSHVMHITDFEEAAITFPPTYKVVKFRNEYAVDDGGELKRTPSWTDRVLWRAKVRSGANHPPPSVTPLHYNSVQDIFSSDHRPVHALLKVQFDGVQSPTRGLVPFRNNIERESARNYKNRDVDFSKTELDFGELPINLTVQKTMKISNRGRNEARVSIREKDKLPQWLKIHSRDGTDQLLVPPDGILVLMFEVRLSRDRHFENKLVHHGKAFKLPVLLLVDPMLVKHTLTIKATVRNSCFGMHYHDLTRYKIPIAFLDPPRADFDSSSSSSSSSHSIDPCDDIERAPQPVAKEVWRLADALFRREWRSSTGAFVFLTPCSPWDWQEVLVRLDYGTKLSDMNDIAIGVCMLEFLRQLPDPVLSRDGLVTAVRAVEARDTPGLLQTFHRLPAAHLNLLFYVLSFIGELALGWSVEDQARVAAVFASTGLLGRSTYTAEKIKTRTRVILYVMEEYAAGRFVPEVVVDISGVDVDQSETESSKKKKWKTKGKNKMKKLLG